MNQRRRNDDRDADRPRFDDVTARPGGGSAYIGHGAFFSGDMGSDSPGDYDYDYAGFKGDVGIDEDGGNQYGGGRYGQGPYEHSQQYGTEGFSFGGGTFGILQRQFENRYVSGGHRGSVGDRYGFSGPGDYSGKQSPEEDRHWRDLREMRGDTGNRRWNEPAYYGALSHDDYVDPGLAGYGRDSDEQAGARHAHREFGGLPDWRGAPDWADPSAYRIFHVEDRPRRARRGPKGYRRSDERILEEIYERIIAAWEIEASDVSVEVQDGTATLTGSVPERRMKHAIEDLVDGTHGVRGIENRIRVRNDDSSRDPRAGS